MEQHIQSTPNAVLVTGATGSIGSAICSALQATPYNQRDPLSQPIAKCNHLIVAHGSENSVWEANVHSLLQVLSAIEVTGRTIVLCSRRSLIPTVQELEYSASKAAAYAICRAHYDNGRNITALCPGWVESRMATTAKATTVIPTMEIVSTIQWLLSIKSRVRELLIEAQ